MYKLLKDIKLLKVLFYKGRKLCEGRKNARNDWQ